MATLDLILLVAWAAIQVPFVVSLWRVKPSKEITRRYARSVLIQSRVPLMKKWKNKIDAADIRVLEEYRKRLFVQYSVFVGSMALLYIYVYFKYIF